MVNIMIYLADEEIQYGQYRGRLLCLRVQSINGHCSPRSNEPLS